MKDGDNVILVPGISTMNLNGSSAHRSRVAEVLRAMTEVVMVISLSNGTGNAKVRDTKDVTFFCNPNDLKPMPPDLY